LYQVMVILEKIIAENALRGTAGCAYSEACHLAHAAAVEINVFAVPAPAGHFIMAAVPGDLLYFAAIHWYQEDIAVAILAPGKGNPFAIRRNPCVCFISLH